MWLFLLSSLVVGVALARLKVWALIPVILIFSMIVVTSGFLSGLKWGTIALTVVAKAGFGHIEA
jgi:cytochrome c oxidase subunit IV